MKKTMTTALTNPTRTHVPTTRECIDIVNAYIEAMKQRPLIKTPDGPNIRFWNEFEIAATFAAQQLADTLAASRPT